MCGIVGYVGKGSAIPILFQGLKKLEYRGYDSSGIAYLNNNEIKIVKQVGKVDNLIKKVNFKNESDCGIAHTRWATHGKPDTINCHPHFCSDFVLVHNGIIENYNELKTEFDNLYSQTDTELIAKVLNKNFNSSINKEKLLNKKVLRAISLTQKQLTGSWAVAVMHRKIKNKIFVFKKESPLAIGASQKFNLIASDLTAICEIFNENSVEKFNLFSLKNFEIAEINCENINFFNENLKKIKKIKLNYDKNINTENLNKFEHFMQKEIFETAKSFELTYNQTYDENFIKLLKNSNHITLIGCGSAYHSCLIGKFLFEKYFNKKVSVELASEFRYKINVFDKNEIVIGVTQSGETADTIAGLKLAKESGALTAVITNTKNSSITEIADFVLYTEAGKEIGVAATKSYVAQISCFLSIIKQISNFQIDVATIAQKINSEINYFTNSCLYSKFYNKQKYFFIGRNTDSVTASEASLKLKEITYVHSEGYPAGELKHGTLSLIDKNSLVIAIITNEKLIDKSLNAVNEVVARGAECVIVSQFNSLAKNANYFLKLESCQEDFMSILSIIPLQCFAYFMSLDKGNDPDKPRNLAKSVTVE